MSATASTLAIENNATVATWFGMGGKAARLARPANIDDLRRALELDAKLTILGDGANLLVADEGVKELVVSLAQGDFARWTAEEGEKHTIIHAGAGVNLPKLIIETTRMGLGGLETLGGIPASVGGAAIMNAGGTFGQTGDCVWAVHGVNRRGEVVSLKRTQIEFTYRHTSLKDLIITGVDFKLRKGDGEAIRKKLKEVMEYKKSTQPMAEKSAGCFFKNPTLVDYVRDIGTPGTRVSAGMLIDKAGCKGLKVGGAEVSDRHANFVVAKPGCTATDVLSLMRQARDKVRDKFGITLEPEVVIWGATL